MSKSVQTPPLNSPPPPTPRALAAKLDKPSIWHAIWERSGILLVFLAIAVGCSVFVDGFFSLANARGLLLSVATIGTIACTMLFCLASGDFDLSVGSVVALSGVTAAVVTNSTQNAFLGISAGLLVGAVVGTANGVVIAIFGINALITTLATMQIARGMAFLVSDGKSVPVPSSTFNDLGGASLGDLSWLAWLGETGSFGKWLLSLTSPIWIVLGCFVLFGVLLNKTIFGRNTLAIGGNKEAAKLAGIPVRFTKILIFALQGTMAGFAGVILASRFHSGQPNTSLGLELQVISACVLGGVSLTGGVGNMWGVVLGVLIMGMVENAMKLQNIPFFWQSVTSGSILLAAVLFDRLKQVGGWRAVWAFFLKLTGSSSRSG